MIHEWWGLREDILEKADDLAGRGYVVLAVDAFRGQVASSVPGAIYMNLTYPQSTIDSDLDASFDYLVSLDNVDAERVAVMGFCFGGRQSMLFGIRRPDELKAILTYYGGSQPITEDELRPLASSDVAVLGIFGQLDETIPIEEVSELGKSLQTLDVPVEITIYEAVGHAFVKDIENPGASRDAWRAGVRFLNQNVRNLGRNNN
jgi:carboxymethylenebutenolidase